MAGQPPEPSFQPSGQDQGLTQGRPAWQPPSYTPPAQPPPAASRATARRPPAQDQAYPPQDQAYLRRRSRPTPRTDQTYTSAGQGQDYQAYQGYQPPGYGAQQAARGRASGHRRSGRGSPACSPGRRGAKQAGEKGFLGSLFDFSFSSFVTPKIIKVLYVLVTIWTALIGLTILIVGFRTGGLAGGLFTLIIIEPIFLLLTLGIYRVVLEAFMVIFRIYEETKKIRENSESQD